MAKLCVTFAGAVGSSKTPTALYLSQQLAWPVFSNDAIRIEVLENTLQDTLDVQLYTTLRNQRLQNMLQQGNNFILDASIDRSYQELQELLDSHSYKLFVISFDLSAHKLKQLYTAKHYFASKPRIPDLMSDHAKFTKQYTGETVTITDKSFNNRLQKAFAAVQNWIATYS